MCFFSLSLYQILSFSLLSHTHTHSHTLTHTHTHRNTHTNTHEHTHTHTRTLIRGSVKKFSLSALPLSLPPFSFTSRVFADSTSRLLSSYCLCGSKHSQPTPTPAQ